MTDDTLAQLLCDLLPSRGDEFRTPFEIPNPASGLDEQTHVLSLLVITTSYNYHFSI